MSLDQRCVRIIETDGARLSYKVYQELAENNRLSRNSLRFLEWSFYIRGVGLETKRVEYIPHDEIKDLAPIEELRCIYFEGTYGGIGSSKRKDGNGKDRSGRYTIGVRVEVHDAGSKDILVVDVGCNETEDDRRPNWYLRYKACVWSLIFSRNYRRALRKRGNLPWG